MSHTYSEPMLCFALSICVNYSNNEKLEGFSFLQFSSCLIQPLLQIESLAFIPNRIPEAQPRPHVPQQSSQNNRRHHWRRKLELCLKPRDQGLLVVLQAGIQLDPRFMLILFGSSSCDNGMSLCNLFVFLISWSDIWNKHTLYNYAHFRLANPQGWSNDLYFSTCHCH